MKRLTLAEFNERYKGICVLVDDPTHPDHNMKCEFVEMIRKPIEKIPVMKVRILTEKRELELKWNQVFIIVKEIPLPRPKDN